MKKRIISIVIIWAAFVVAAVYTLVAALLVRGLGVYRLDVTVGMVLAYSWPYTALAAIVLLATGGIILLTVVLKKREDKLAAAPAQPVPAESQTIAEKPIPPAAPEESAQQTEKLAPAAPIEFAEQASDLETVQLGGSV